MSDPLDRALDAVLAGLPTDLPVAAPDPVVAERVRAAGHVVEAGPVAALPVGSVAAVVLGADEVTVAGEGAEELVAAAVESLRPAGVLVLTARGDVAAGRGRARRVPAGRESPPPADGPRSFDTAGIEHLLLHRGLTVLRLQDEGGRLLGVGRAPVGARERTARFLSSLTFTLVTAAVLCRDDEGRLLCVFDRFRGHWTVPGGAVDAGEDPRSGAVREAYEEAGVRVRATALAGIFSAPVRLLLIYAAEPIGPADPAPVTRHPHEIGEVRWLPVTEALETLNPAARWQVERCLDTPGETWCD